VIHLRADALSGAVGSTWHVAADAENLSLLEVCRRLDLEQRFSTLDFLISRTLEPAVWKASGSRGKVGQGQGAWFKVPGRG